MNALDTASESIDSLDRGILRFLMKDARMPFTTIADRLDVSSGTIHQRVNRMKETGIIIGSEVKVDFKKLGFDVTTLLGVHLKSANDHLKVAEKLEHFSEVVEVNYTTGKYALIVKVKTRSTGELHQFLVNKLQSINEVSSTESFICLNEMINRDLMP